MAKKKTKVSKKAPPASANGKASKKTAKKKAAGKSSAKRPTAAAVAGGRSLDQFRGYFSDINDSPLSTEELRKAKTGLTKRDKEKYKQMLLEKRADLLGDMASLQSDNLDVGNLSHMPLHMADVGSDNYEHEFNLGLMESERKLLREIDAALVRIVDGTYGVCLESGKPIGKARLDLKPWAKYCIEVVREKEARGEL